MLRVAVLAAVVATAASATLPESAQLTAAAARQPTLDAALVRWHAPSLTQYVACHRLRILSAFHSSRIACDDGADACSFHD